MVGSRASLSRSSPQVVGCWYRKWNKSKQNSITNFSGIQPTPLNRNRRTAKKKYQFPLSGSYFGVFYFSHPYRPKVFQTRGKWFLFLLDYSFFMLQFPADRMPDGSCGAALAWEWGGWFFCFFLPLNGCLLFCLTNHSLHFRVCPSGKGASPSRVDLICNLISIQPPVAFPFKLHLIIQFTSVAMGKTRGCPDEHSSFRAKGHTHAKKAKDMFLLSFTRSRNK